MDARIVRFAEMAVVDRGNGVRSTPLVSNALGSEKLTTGITALQPGAEIRPHSHNCDESVCVLEGEVTFEAAGQRHSLSVCDSTFVPEGVTHRLLNESDRPARILWIYTSGHVTRTFSETGQTVKVGTADDRAIPVAEPADH
jgi:quercetin dioxygenase-like cupin family protein